MEQLDLPLEKIPCKHIWEELEEEDCLDGPNSCYWTPYLKCKWCLEEDWSYDSVKEFRNSNK
jgi:hypothetical protein